MLAATAVAGLCPPKEFPVSVLGIQSVQCVPATPCSGIYAASGTAVGACPPGSFCSVFPESELVMTMRCAITGYTGAVALNADGSMNRLSSSPTTAPTPVPSDVPTSKPIITTPTPAPQPSESMAPTSAPNATTLLPNVITLPPNTTAEVPVITTAAATATPPTTLPNSAYQSENKASIAPSSSSAGLGASAVIGICIGAVALVAVAIGVRAMHHRQQSLEAAAEYEEDDDPAGLTPRRQVVLL
ncbi:hypothetical protein ACHHYP_07231 [Achlya hypogyna]|uniref:Uncharacterized protein n=1 Tax=Achlya hypogyna TaxID=1202772 RepID=A0A1V9ZMD5_ACHHY|nr:hypothetical protein ACHHYP_07231 [Achlya hypogyna]